jgi:hypothetical protein
MFRYRDHNSPPLVYCESDESRPRPLVLHWRLILILFPRLRLGVPSRLFSFRFSRRNSLYIPLLSSLRSSPDSVLFTRPNRANLPSTILCWFCCSSFQWPWRVAIRHIPNSKSHVHFTLLWSFQMRMNSLVGIATSPLYSRSGDSNPGR